MKGSPLTKKMREWIPRARAQWRLYGDPGRPTQIHLCPTDRCNLTCRQCDIWRIDPGDELSTKEWKDVLDQIADLTGAASLNFAGGEPFIRHDLPELMEHAVHLGFTVSANTNGLLITDDMAERLHDIGLDILYISLDGATAETHDRIRNRKGTFRKVLQAFDRLDRYGAPRVVIAAILHRHSIPEAGDLLELARSRGYQIVFQPIMQTFSEPYDPQWYRRSPLIPTDYVELDRQLDHLIAVKRDHGPICNAIAQLESFRSYFRAPTLPNGLRCKAGFQDISLDPYGNFMVCYHLRPAGNVRKTPIRELWWGAEAAVRRQEVASCPRTCNLQNCNFERHEV